MLDTKLLWLQVGVQAATITKTFLIRYFDTTTTNEKRAAPHGTHHYYSQPVSWDAINRAYMSTCRPSSCAPPTAKVQENWISENWRACRADVGGQASRLDSLFSFQLCLRIDTELCYSRAMKRISGII